MRANILFLFTDQQRHDTIAALGAPIIRTPVLDRLVEEGVAFDRCYTPSPVCVSARHALVTGLPPHATGVVDNQGKKPASTAYFMEHLSASGYRTHGIGKMHFFPDPHEMRGFQSRDVSEPFGEDDYKEFLSRRGFGYVDEPFGVRSEYYYVPQVSQLPAEVHHTHWVADRAIEFLRTRPRDRPFFLWAGFIKPHPPFESPTPWNKLYRAAEMPAPHRPPEASQQLGFWNHVQNRYKYRDAGHDELLVRTMRAAYYSSISFIDFNVGRILDALGEDLEETYVVFSSDHGEMLGDFGAYGKRCMLEASVRVPLILRQPRARDAGERVHVPVSLLDLYATFLDVADCGNLPPQPERVDLRSFVRSSRERLVYSQFSSGEWGTYMVTDGIWKYSFSAADQQEWLHRLDTPDGEDRNLIGDTSAVAEAARLRGQLIARLSSAGYAEAVDGSAWRRYGQSAVPLEPDAGLLFQDPPTLQSKVDLLEGYARSILPPGKGGDILARIRRI